MLKYVDAAILMKVDKKKLKVLSENVFDLDGLLKIPPLEVFDQDVIEFLDILSKNIFKDKRAKEYPDVITFAFFCRKGNIEQQKKHYNQDDFIRLGKGLAFHISPSNVPVNFAYSLVAGLLSGNINIIRIPSKSFEQVEIIIDAIKRISNSRVSDRVIIISYDHESTNITEELSALCDIRVIWGGDKTINDIRTSKLSPRTTDLTFADRYSICLINADVLLEKGDFKDLISGFYNDTYLFDQNACTSPHLVAWIGLKKNVSKAKSLFWDHLNNFVH